MNTEQIFINEPEELIDAKAELAAAVMVQRELPPMLSLFAWAGVLKAHKRLCRLGIYPQVPYPFWLRRFAVWYVTR